ncbi:hypothetical protein [Paenibacillus illinoisensis]|uniref:hypothetical protein n=1 Tax=Paenibacillus illinoisensis TaxID=59845 RepID=UPI0030172327
MPRIDNYSLDNYGLDGPLKGNVSKLVTPNISYYSPDPSYLMSNQLGVTQYFDIVTLPAGTKLLSATAPDPGSYTHIYLGTSNGIDAGNTSIVLTDSNGVDWTLFANTTTSSSGFSHITVAIELGVSYIRDSTIGKPTYTTSAPSNFNKNGETKLRFKCRSNTSGFWTLYLAFRGTPLVFA